MRTLSRWLATATLIGLVGFVGYSYAEGGIVAVLFSRELTAADKIEVLRAFFAALGWGAPLVYVAIVTVEVVVAPIPGTVLYAPAGVIFGGFWGGTLSLIGNITGAGISFLLMRALGRSAFRHLIEREQLERYEQRVVDHGTLVIFLLRINPLTSSDIVSYAAGATAMPISRLLAGTTLGMAPLCYAQAYLAEGLLAAYPRLIYPVLILGLVYAVLFVAIIRRTVRAERRVAGRREDGASGPAGPSGG